MQQPSQMDPWRFMALVAECAAASGVETEKAFRLMAAITVAMGRPLAPTPPQPAPTPPPAPSTNTPQ